MYLSVTTRSSTTHLRALGSISVKLWLREPPSPLNSVKFSLNSTYATVSCTFPNLSLKFGLGMSKNKCSLRVLPSVIKYLSILHIQQPMHKFKEGRNEYKFITKL
jgi:hypothetical protein